MSSRRRLLVEIRAHTGRSHRKDDGDRYLKIGCCSIAGFIIVEAYAGPGYHSPVEHFCISILTGHTGASPHALCKVEDLFEPD